ncbi:MAG: ABC transporter ATP-binding protein [Clostridiales bacterium]|jgi:putative ABC transport system ATP-binding protein|nr:ABC transporter ATP-binding protein [Clostridiales bacterium]MDR2711895.1 ABC transporter ATP-binding protein [Clostridiales bacterium]
MSNTILTTQKLCKTFSNQGLQQHVLKNLDLEIKGGDFTVIMGPSGAGKSTLLYALSGMDKPTLGKIIFGGRDISQFSNDHLALFRRKNCGFVFQQIYLMDNMSLMDNVLAAGLLVSKKKKTLAHEAAALFEQVGISEGLWRKFPTQVSGGEAQRAAIIRALINQPRIIFADEPTGSLNSAAGTAVLDILSEVNREGRSIVMVTHDLKSALRGNRIIYLKDGAVCGECNLAEYVIEDPKRSEQLLAFLKEMGW